MSNPNQVIINLLVVELLQYDHLYFNDEPLISDAEYDVLKLKLKQLDPTNDYFNKVGAAVRNKKVELPYSMGSLDQKYDNNDLTNWFTKYKIKTTVITEKLDGYSCMLVYNNDVLIGAYSRGDGIEGSDVTKHARYIQSIPNVLDSKLLNGGAAYPLLVIRGEVIMEKDIFTKKYSGVYKNPRNLVNGIMNRKESAEDILKDINFVAYEIVNDIGELTKNESLELLEQLNFFTPHKVMMDVEDIDSNLLNALIVGFRKQSGYELDGIVVTIDDLSNVEQISQSSSLNPEHSIKWKVLDVDNFAISEVMNVEWNKSKNGLLKPRVQIKPVELSGVTITYVTGHNARFINDNKIGVGALIKITRNGDVIPYIAGVISSEKADLPTDVNWEWTTNDKGEQVEIAVVDKNDPEVLFRQVLDFCTSMEVDLLKEASLRTVFDMFNMSENDYKTNLGILFDLLPHEWESVLGVNGGKIHASLHRRLQNLSMPTLLGSLNFLGVGFGVRKAKTLLEQASLDELVTMSIDDIAHLNGFDTKTATNIFNGLPDVVQFLHKFDDYLEFKQEEVKQDVLNGIVVVMTGFRDPDLQKKIESLGGKVGSSVSGKTTHLLQKDPKSKSSKTQKAEEVGAKIMSPEQFKDTFNL